jgi:hypothetical protein
MKRDLKNKLKQNPGGLSARLLVSLLMILSLATLPGVAEQNQTPQSASKQKSAALARDLKPVLWKDPGEVEQLDFVGGPGGRDHAPKPPFTFVEENLSGSNPKVKLRDANGVQWSVKWGSEVNAETFATRLVWALGYFVEPAYFVPRGKIEGASGLKRANKVIASDGSFTDARFERQKEKGVKELDEEQSWSWVDNPFVGRAELNGLKILVMLLSNWDNKDVRDVKRGSNTAIFLYPDEARYLITDWGGSMGKWGGYFSREKWDCQGFSSQSKDFMLGVKNGELYWGYSGQHSSSFKDGIKVEDAKWLMRYLGRVTDAQLRAGLEASGATAEEQQCFTRAIRERINRLKQITDGA